jgi:ATP-dependent DNA ligase
VVEVLYDQVTADRFRHGARLLRWRPDKAARQCGIDQLVYELRPSELAGIR